MFCASPDAWSEVDADEESNAASSRPGSAPAFRQGTRPRSAKQRPVTAGVAKARDSRPIERPIHGATFQPHEVERTDTTFDNSRPTTMTKSRSRAVVGGDLSSQLAAEPLAITNGVSSS